MPYSCHTHDHTYTYTCHTPGSISQFLRWCLKSTVAQQCMLHVCWRSHVHLCSRGVRKRSLEHSKTMSRKSSKKCQMRSNNPTFDPNSGEFWSSMKFAFPGDHLTKMDEHHKAAYEVLCSGGKVTEQAVLEALLHGHEKLLDAMVDATRIKAWQVVGFLILSEFLTVFAMFFVHLTIELWFWMGHEILVAAGQQSERGKGRDFK